VDHAKHRSIARSCNKAGQAKGVDLRRRDFVRAATPFSTAKLGIVCTAAAQSDVARPPEAQASSPAANMTRSLQSHGFGQLLSDRQPGREPAAIATKGRASLTVLRWTHARSVILTAVRSTTKQVQLLIG